MSSDDDDFEPATVATGMSFDEMLEQREREGAPDELPGEATVASGAYALGDDADGPSPGPGDDLAYAQTAMGPSYDERIARARAAAEESGAGHPGANHAGANHAGANAPGHDDPGADVPSGATPGAPP
ncbi:MAG TPA: hypothetical protein RMH99_19335, partial [Sandaracinaceae bacterium LLY-WYZ-13_1]|nr:hypothetical protein [Sandaracinaceae bacterium LLY-WYZ-13_1]